MKRKRYRIDGNGDIYYHTEAVNCQLCMENDKCKIFKSINESTFLDDEYIILFTIALECSEYKQRGALLLDKEKNCKDCMSFFDCRQRILADSYEGKEEMKGISRIIEGNICSDYKGKIK